MILKIIEGGQDVDLELSRILYHRIMWSSV